VFVDDAYAPPRTPLYAIEVGEHRVGGAHTIEGLVFWVQGPGYRGLGSRVQGLRSTV